MAPPPSSTSTPAPVPPEEQEQQQQQLQQEDDDEEEEEEETLRLLVVAGVTSLARTQALVTSFVSAPGRAQGPTPDLIVALGPFALKEDDEEENQEMEKKEEQTRGSDATQEVMEEGGPRMPLPWEPQPLDMNTVEGRAAEEADLTTLLALLENVSCRLTYLPCAGLDPPSCMDTPPPQLTLSAINAHDTVVQLLPGLFLGGLAHTQRGQRGRWAAEKATARTLKAAGRLAAISAAGGGEGEQEGEGADHQQQQRHPQQLIMLETFLAGPPPPSSSNKGGGGAAAAANAAEASGPFALSPAFLAQATADKAADCRLLLHIGYTHQRPTTGKRRRPWGQQEEEEEQGTEEGKGALPCAARYEAEGGQGEEEGGGGPTLVAPASFGREGSYALVRLGRPRGRRRDGGSMWTVREVAFERVR